MAEQPRDANNIFSIDGQPVPFEPGDSILSAAHRSGVYIPHLCFHPDLSAHGSCKLCTVEITGRFASACTTEASNNIEVTSNSETLLRYRRQLLEMLFAEGNHFCPSCELSGNCQLQALAYDAGMTHASVPLQFPKRGRDASHPFVFLDRDRCINCALCCRASIEKDHKQVFSLQGRGSEAHLQVHSVDGTLKNSALEPTDLAANICPVGALFHKQGNYQEIPGERLYDEQPISIIGNQRPALPGNGRTKDD